MLTFNTTFNTTTLTNDTPTFDPKFNGALATATASVFPVFHGVPGSWAAMTDFMDAFTAGYNARDSELGPSQSEATSNYFEGQSGPGSWARVTDFSDGFEYGWRFGNGLSIRKRTICPKKKVSKPSKPSKPKDKKGWTEVNTKTSKSKSSKSKRVYDRYSVHSITLIIKNLPNHPSVVDLKEIFEMYGKVSHIKFILKEGECSGIGFVTFKTPQGSARAFNALHKIPYRNQIVYTEYARGR